MRGGNFKYQNSLSRGLANDGRNEPSASANRIYERLNGKPIKNRSDRNDRSTVRIPGYNNDSHEREYGRSNKEVRNGTKRRKLSHSYNPRQENESQEYDDPIQDDHAFSFSNGKALTSRPMFGYTPNGMNETRVSNGGNQLYRNGVRETSPKSSRYDQRHINNSQDTQISDEISMFSYSRDASQVQRHQPREKAPYPSRDMLNNLESTSITLDHESRTPQTTARRNSTTPARNGNILYGERARSFSKSADGQNLKRNYRYSDGDGDQAESVILSASSVTSQTFDQFRKSSAATYYVKASKCPTRIRSPPRIKSPVVKTRTPSLYLQKTRVFSEDKLSDDELNGPFTMNIISPPLSKNIKRNDSDCIELAVQTSSPGFSRKRKWTPPVELPDYVSDSEPERSVSKEGITTKDVDPGSACSGDLPYQPDLGNETVASVNPLTHVAIPQTFDQLQKAELILGQDVQAHTESSPSSTDSSHIIDFTEPLPLFSPPPEADPGLLENLNTSTEPHDNHNASIEPHDTHNASNEKELLSVVEPQAFEPIKEDEARDVVVISTTSSELEKIRGPGETSFVELFQQMRDIRPIKAKNPKVYGRNSMTRGEEQARLFEELVQNDNGGNEAEQVKPQPPTVFRRTQTRSLVVSNNEKEKKITQTIPKWSEPLTWPFTGPRRCTIDYEDLDRFGTDEFLNDNLINFFLRYLEIKQPEQSKRVHFMNTHFYTSMSKRVDSSGINYDAVKSWTRKIDLFSIPYIMIPVNKNAHWFLIIVCNAHKLLDVQDNAIEEEISPILVVSSVDDHDTIAATNDINGISTNKEIGQEMENMSLDPSSVYDFPTSNEPYSPTRSKFFTWGNKTPVVSTLIPEKPTAVKSESKLSRNKVQKKEKIIIPSKPIVLAFDSMNDAHGNEIRSVRKYLACEAKDKKSKDIDWKDIANATVQGLPCQENGSDCGLFLIRYAAAFLQNPEELLEKISKNQIDPDMGIAHQRQDMLKLILKLKAEQLAHIAESKQKTLADKQDKITADGGQRAVNGDDLDIIESETGHESDDVIASSPITRKTPVPARDKKLASIFTRPVSQRLASKLDSEVEAVRVDE